MTMVEWLTTVTNSYLVALGLVVYLIVEGIKASQLVSVKQLSLVASLVGGLMGLVIGLI